MLNRKSDRVIGKKLKEARNSLGLTQGEVAHKLGFPNYQSLLKIENGSRPVKVSELTKLAQIYFKDMPYFLSESQPDEQMPVFAWRDRQNDRVKEIEARIHWLLKNYKLFEELCGQARGNVLKPWPKKDTKLDFKSVTKKAESFVDSMKLGARPSLSLARILEENFGVKILYIDLGNHGSAVSSIGYYGNAILINLKESPWRRNFNIAHELFHLLSAEYYPFKKIHCQTTKSKPREERLADTFAAALLMPESQLLKDIQSKAKNGKIASSELFHLAIEYEVSFQALLWRLVNLHKISRKTCEDLLESSELKEQNRKLRRNMNSCAQEFSSRFVWLGLKAMNLGRISIGKFCKVFHIRRSQFRDFVNDRGDLEHFSQETSIQLNHS